jgi:hypothetical protein
MTIVLSKRMVIAIALLLLCLQGCSDAQNPGRPDRAKPSSAQVTMNPHLVRDAVQSFLSVWLIERDPGRAALFFGKDAFQNEAMLSDSCTGYIKANERASEAARRAGVDKFLSDFVPSEPKPRLSEVLNRAAVAPLIKQMAGKLTNNPNVDQFAVAKLTKDDLPLEESKESDYLRLKLPATFYVSFVPIGEGVVYFVWIPEGKTWRIYHASLVCM